MAKVRLWGQSRLLCAIGWGKVRVTKGSTMQGTHSGITNLGDIEL